MKDRKGPLRPVCCRDHFVRIVIKRGAAAFAEEAKPMLPPPTPQTALNIYRKVNLGTAAFDYFRVNAALRLSDFAQTRVHFCQSGALRDWEWNIFAFDQDVSSLSFVRRSHPIHADPLFFTDCIGADPRAGASLLVLRFL
jgi:hypothetical protein